MATTGGQPVDDPDQLNQKQQLREIHEARQDVRDVRWKVRESEVFEGLSAKDSNGLYRAAVESYVQELIPLMTSQAFDAGSELLTGEEFGVVRCRREIETSLENVEVREQTQPIVGLESLFELPSPLVFRFERESGSHRSVATVETVRETREIPRHVLDRILIACDEFRQEIGLGLDADRGLPEISAQR